MLKVWQPLRHNLGYQGDKSQWSNISSLSLRNDCYRGRFYLLLKAVCDQKLLKSQLHVKPLYWKNP